MFAPSFLPVLQAFGLMVVHSLWQIALIWLIFKVLELQFRHRHQTVYRLSMAGMGISAIWSISTFVAVFLRLRAVPTAPETAAVNAAPPEALPPLAQAPASASPDTWLLLQNWIETHALQIGMIWLTCAALLWLRLAGGWWLARRLRYRNVVPAPETAAEVCAVWAQRLGIRRVVQLLESPHIAEPITLGYWKPLILFPAGMLLQLSPAQTEALILHELAHIRRNDYLINLVQLVLEACFFYHPLFWLLSKEARVRREFCCDIMVVQHTHNPLLYAQTLTNLQLQTVHPPTQFVMNATGKSRFTERILYIAGITPKRSARPNFILFLLLPLLLFLFAGQPSKGANTPEQPSETTASLLPERPVTSSITDVQDAPQQPQSDAPALTQIAYENPNLQTDQLSLIAAPDSAAPRTIAIEAVKMNVLYIGVDNPIRIAADGIPATELKVELLGDGMISGKNGNYVAQVRQPGLVTIRVMRQNGSETVTVTEQKYRVKRIPDPVPRLDYRFRGGDIALSDLQAAKGIFALMENFDFDAVCEMVSFEATLLSGTPPDPITAINNGATWAELTQGFIRQAKSGDRFFFDNILVKCPGDANPRNLGGLAFKIR